MTALGEVEQPLHILPAVCPFVMLGCFTKCELGACHTWTQRFLLRHKARKLMVCHQKQGAGAAPSILLGYKQKNPLLRSQEAESCSRSTLVWEENTPHAFANMWLQVPHHSLSQPSLMMCGPRVVWHCLLGAGLAGLLLEKASPASPSAGCCPCETASSHLKIQYGPVSSTTRILLSSFIFLNITQLCCKLPNACLKQLIWAVPPRLISVICGMHTALMRTGPPLCCTIFARTGITQDNQIWNNQSRKQQ